ncbi:ADP-ribosylglycohydrolase [Devosia epidermidihirudinis]|uniref:ADP-ribosylglycohydrolase n=1 Tax=Devosia epidermidihirudinis TaxID=1293439 RepID=A0A0F5Q4W4_9HYPH|nr:ADP-ribosylglycohydrolase family protein [Devosia epidermidihirudinis]KKC35930.1 ADP-ribosylglycohydrolase [Devosia epidermidihirudinis]
MTSTTLADRAAGAVLGALIGDALGVGPHWYYDLDELRREYGPWIDGYTAPRPGRYHDGLKPGDLSQAGIIAELLLDAVLESGGYDAAAFTAKLDGDLFPQLDGIPTHGPGGYTSQSIRETWRKRVLDKREWGDVAGLADTTEAAERIFVVASLYATDPWRAATASRDNTLLTQNDTTVAALTTAFGSVIAALVRGEALDADISSRLFALVHQGRLPFHHVTRPGSTPPLAGSVELAVGANFPSPDALSGVSTAVRSALDPAITIEPASKIAQVYGLPCAIYYQLPAAYYLAARFPNSFENAVLHAINGGGQNQARAILTGALAGAQLGIDAIPRRFITGLSSGAELERKARALGRLAENLAGAAAA